MPRHVLTGQTPIESDFTCVASDVLSKLMSGLTSLEIENRRLTLALATAGHDLRQRLQHLLGTVELISASTDKVRSTELSRRAKTLIFRFAGELEQLALQAERDQSLAGSAACSFTIAPLLGQLKNDWESEAAAKCLRFGVEQVSYWVESDQRLLAVILNNVVGNAVRHTSQGEVTVASSIDGRFLILAVSDTGPGISDEDIRRSFSFSSRLRGIDEGMGLGLSIARKTAELLGHEFDVSTGSHGGTCVRLHVPIHSPAETAVPAR
jgi:signal transduction histidine kinase